MPRAPAPKQRYLAITIEAEERRIGGIVADLKEHGDVRITDISVIETGRRKPVSDARSIAERREIIVEALKKGPARRSEIISKVGLEPALVSNQLNALKEMKVVKRIGNAPGNFKWQLTGKALPEDSVNGDGAAQ